MRRFDQVTSHFHSLGRKQFVLIMFVFELLGTIFGGSAVADVIQSLSSWPKEPSLLPLLLSALVAAILWNFLARRCKMPASSTHSLIGAVIGSLFAGQGSFEYVELGEFDPVHPSGVIDAVISLILSPMLGFLIAYPLFCGVILLSLRASGHLEKWFVKAQWFTTACLAFGDGQNDTQKTMGLMVLAMNAAGVMQGHEIPLWIRILIGIAMAAGAFSISSGVIKELAYHV